MKPGDFQASKISCINEAVVPSVGKRYLQTNTFTYGDPVTSINRFIEAARKARAVKRESLTLIPR